jgi:hypothetical protein
MRRALKYFGLTGLGFIIIFSLIFGGFQLGVENIRTPEFTRSTIGDTINIPILTISHVDAATVADYTIDGTADDVQFQSALDALPATGGIIQVMSSGTITFTATVSRAINNVTIIGTGQGTLFNYDASHALFSVGSQTGWSFKDLATDAGGITNYTTAYLENIKLGSTVYVSRLPNGQNYTGNLTGWASNVTFANNATFATSAGTATTANNATFATSAGTATTANNASQLNGQTSAFYTNATSLNSGTVPTARLGTGTANATSYLRGDQTWATISNITSGSSGNISAGTTFPVSPGTGDQFLHSVTGRKILYQYDGSTWKPVQGYGALTVYVDNTDGTDDLLHGTAVDAGAFKTINYAYSIIPPTYDSVQTININNETYNEMLILPRKIGVKGESGYNCNINIIGTLNQNATATMDSAVVGTGSTRGSITDSGSMTGKANKLIYANSEYRVIDSSTSNTTTICGCWSGAPSGNYTIYNWGTKVTGVYSIYGDRDHEMKGIYFKYIEFEGSNLDVLVTAGCALSFADCKFNKQVTAELNSSILFEDCYFYQTNEITATSNSSLEILRGKIDYHWGAGGFGLQAVRNASIYVDGGVVLEGNSVAAIACGAQMNGVFYFDPIYSTSMGNAQIRNWGTYGCNAITGGQIIGTATNQYASNGSDENATAASFGYID